MGVKTLWCHLAKLPLPFRLFWTVDSRVSSLKSQSLFPKTAHLAIRKLKDQLDLVPLNLLRLDLRGHPSFCRIGLPRPCPNIITVCHPASHEAAVRPARLSKVSPGKRERLGPTKTMSTTFTAARWTTLEGTRCSKMAAEVLSQRRGAEDFDEEAYR